MKIAIVQIDIKWSDHSANLRKAEEAIRMAGSSDLYVLPEMFSTGFATEPEGIAEQHEGGTLRWMQHVAKEYDAAVAGSCAVKDTDGTYRNRFYFVKPDGSYEYYDKHHLFTYGNEHEKYTYGIDRKVVEWRGVRFLLQVCYDLRFPVYARNNDDVPYDCCLYVANWPESRRRVWDTLLKARAMENQCYVIGVNRVGDDLVCHYNGGTQAIDAYGRGVARVDDDKEGTANIILDMEKLTAFRKKFPVLNDADKTR